jgi:hypothetical protein
MMKNSAVLTIIAVVMAACASNPLPVPLEGNRESLASLAGEWAGSYVGYDSGRSGSIIFVLGADGETATGDVLMIPRRMYQLQDNEEASDSAREADWPQPISIRFVHAEAQGIFGQLDEYQDPDCGCRLQTSFRGQLTGNRIEGTFLTRHVESGERQSGTWHVERSGTWID